MYWKSRNDLRVAIASMGVAPVISDKRSNCIFDIMSPKRLSHIFPDFVTYGCDHKYFTCQASDALSLGHCITWLVQIVFCGQESEKLNPPKVIGHKDANPPPTLPLRSNLTFRVPNNRN
jgi:hypothetical protein